MFPVALRMVWDVYEAVDIPIIGCGGVSSAETAAEMMLAGASAVEVGAANLRNPYACKEIIEDLPRRLRPAGRHPYFQTDRRSTSMSAKDVIIALDFPTESETLAFLDQFPAGEKPFVKIGMELYYAEGPAVVRALKDRGHKIFLDLKLHDIPNTVRRAMAVLSRLDVDMVTSMPPGAEMMRAALEASPVPTAPVPC